MESFTRVRQYPRAVLFVVVVVLLLVAVAGGYAIRFATASTTAPIKLVTSGAAAPTSGAAGASSGAAAAPFQSNAPCVWTANGKGC